MLVASCPVANFDAGTGECAAIVWVEQSQGFPPLAADDGLYLGGLVLGVWVIGFGWRVVAQFLKGVVHGNGE